LKTEQKIGLFGGRLIRSTWGHLLVAQAACEEAGLGRLFFIPAAQSPFKPDTTRRRRRNGCVCCGSRWPAKIIMKLTSRSSNAAGISYSMTRYGLCPAVSAGEIILPDWADHAPSLPSGASRGTGAAGGSSWRSAARQAGRGVCSAVPGADAEGLAAGRFGIANPRAGEDGPAD